MDARRCAIGGLVMPISSVLLRRSAEADNRDVVVPRTTGSVALYGIDETLPQIVRRIGAWLGERVDDPLFFERPFGHALGVRDAVGECDQAVAGGERHVVRL